MQPKCVVRIFRKDAELLAREFGKEEEELARIVKKDEQFVPITLTGLP